MERAVLLSITHSGRFAYTLPLICSRFVRVDALKHVFDELTVPVDIIVQVAHTIYVPLEITQPHFLVRNLQFVQL